jgi:hypothetical protein
MTRVRAPCCRLRPPPEAFAAAAEGTRASTIGVDRTRIAMKPPKTTEMIGRDSPAIAALAELIREGQRVGLLLRSRRQPADLPARAVASS